MAKKPIVHCRICKGDIDRNIQIENVDWVMPSKNWFYHKRCYMDWAKKKNDIHSKGNEEDWFSAMWEYLSKDLKIGPDFSKIKSQWANFLKKGFTPKGIYFSIRYHYEIKKGDSKKSEGGIGIVPYIYEECKGYWVKRESEFNDICTKIEKQIKELKEKKPKEVEYIRRERKVKQLSLSDILEGEDE